MRRFFLMIVIMTAVVFSGHCLNNADTSASDYEPYPSELMMMRLGTRIFGQEENMEYGSFPYFFKRVRLVPTEFLYPGMAGIYQIDSITPDFISLRSAASEEILNRKDDDSAITAMLGVLPTKNKKTIGVTVTTIYPGGVPMSELCFYEFPSIKQMLLEEDSTRENEEKFFRASGRTVLESDSTLNRLYTLAQEAGLLDPIPEPVDLDDDPSRTEPTQLPTSRMIKEPTIADFFTIPSGNKGKEVKEAIESIPFAMVSYQLSPADMSLTARLHYEALVSMETASELQPYLLPSIRYRWDGTRYKKE